MPAKRPPPRLSMVLMCGALALGGVGCSDDASSEGPGAPAPDAPGQARATDELARLRAELARLTADVSCRSDSECASVALGSKSCGGPEEYRVYSRPRVDETELRRLAEEYTTLDRQLDERDGIVSDCAFVVEPVTACRDGRCEVVGTVDARGGVWRDESGH